MSSPDSGPTRPTTSPMLGHNRPWPRRSRRRWRRRCAKGAAAAIFSLPDGLPRWWNEAGAVVFGLPAGPASGAESRPRSSGPPVATGLGSNGAASRCTAFRRHLAVQPCQAVGRRGRHRRDRRDPRAAAHPQWLGRDAATAGARGCGAGRAATLHSQCRRRSRGWRGRGAP